MTSPSEAVQELLKFVGAISVLSGLMTWRRGGPKEDEIVVAAADTILDSLSDADKVNTVDLHSGKNMRDQITIEQAQELHNERELRSWKNRN